MSADFEELRKRTLATKGEIFPLDKMLPLVTVYRIFLDHYAKVQQKSQFMKRKYQKLREAYHALFVAVALSKVLGKEAYMVIPSDEQNDITILLRKGDQQFEAVPCDVKELTIHSPSFSDFLEKTVKKHINQYHFIIGVYTSMDRSDLDELMKILEGNTSRAWVVSSPSPDNENPDLGHVTFIETNQTLKLTEVDLAKDLPFSEHDPLVIYHDHIKYRQV